MKYYSALQKKFDTCFNNNSNKNTQTNLCQQNKPDAEDNITCLAVPAWSSSETGVWGRVVIKSWEGEMCLMGSVPVGDDEEGFGNVGEVSTQHRHTRCYMLKAVKMIYLWNINFTGIFK